MDFSMLQCLVFHYINPANHAPGAQRVHSMGVIYSHRLKIFFLQCFSEFMRPTTQVSGILLIEPLVGIWIILLRGFG